MFKVAIISMIFAFVAITCINGDTTTVAMPDDTTSVYMPTSSAGPDGPSTGPAITDGPTDGTNSPSVEPVSSSTPVPQTTTHSGATTTTILSISTIVAPIITFFVFK